MPSGVLQLHNTLRNGDLKENAGGPECKNRSTTSPLRVNKYKSYCLNRIKEREVRKTAELRGVNGSGYHAEVCYSE